MEFGFAANWVPDTEFVAATAFALAPEFVPDTALAVGEVVDVVGVSIDVNPELIWINCCRLLTPTSCEM
jgi:hypothetical protein